jgi:hypothetical protein
MYGRFGFSVGFGWLVRRKSYNENVESSTPYDIIYVGDLYVMYLVDCGKEARWGLSHFYPFFQKVSPFYHPSG